MDPKTQASNILRLILSRRRTSQEGRRCTTTPCARCADLHLSRVEALVARGEPLLFVLPGFPGKSPNLRKVLGRVPDKAEWLSLASLQSLCDRIAEEYAPGACIRICSGGRLFSALVGTSEADVIHYQVRLQRMLQELGAHSVSIFQLEDAFGPGRTVDAMCQALLARHGEPLESFQAEVQRGGEAVALYGGLARILLEDAGGLEDPERVAAVHGQTYLLIQRSKAWGALVAEQFPEALRLSIHPQPCGSRKLGIHFLPTENDWLTPWHGAAVEVAGRFVLMQRHEAERLGCTLVHSGGCPSHFVAPEASIPSVPSSFPFSW